MRENTLLLMYLKTQQQQLGGGPSCCKYKLDIFLLNWIKICLKSTILFPCHYPDVPTLGQPICLPLVGQRWANGQTTVGPTTDAIVGPTEPFWWAQRWPTHSVLPGWSPFMPRLTGVQGPFKWTPPHWPRWVPPSTQNINIFTVKDPKLSTWHI